MSDNRCKEKEEKKPVVAKTEEESVVVKLEHEDKKKPLSQLRKISTPKESPAIAPFRNEFKMSGQIGDSRQKDRLSFTTLAH